MPLNGTLKLFTAPIFIFCLMLFPLCISAQTISWSGYTAGALTYTAGPMNTTITNNPSNYYINSSPRYHSTNNSDIHPSNNNCGSIGLLMEMDWGNNANSQNYATTLLINFSSCVIGPVTFTLYDVNTDNFNDWGDWIDISGTTNAGATAAPTVTGCAPNAQTIGNVKRIRGGIASSANTTGCTCGYTNVSVGTAGQKLTSVTLKYFADPQAWALSPNNPAFQYIIVSNITVGSISCTLPIELVSFSGSAKDGIKTFNWVTASELNNDHFTLEHSKDAVDFFPVGETIKGAGTSNIQHTYSTQVEDEEGYIYYRLKQTDLDGTYTYSRMILVQEKEGDPVAALSKFYFNPATHQVEMEIFSNKYENYEVCFTNLMGQVISRHKVAVFPGTNTLILPFHSTSTEINFLSIQGDNIYWVKKLF